MENPSKQIDSLEAELRETAPVRVSRAADDEGIDGES